MVTAPTLHPEVLWAQREDVLYVTVNLADAKQESIELDEQTLRFSAKAGADEKPYAFELTFYAPVLPAESKKVNLGRQFGFVIKKKEDGPYWPRLTQEKLKAHWLKTDFAKWKDEDEEVDSANIDNPFGGMDMSSMMGGGMPDMGGMDMASLMSQMGGSGGGMPGGMNFDMGAEEGDSDDEEQQQQQQPEEHEKEEQ